MEQKLNKLYLDCIDELNKIGIDIKKYCYMEIVKRMKYLIN